MAAETRVRVLCCTGVLHLLKGLTSDWPGLRATTPTHLWRKWEVENGTDPGHITPVGYTTNLD